MHVIDSKISWTKLACRLNGSNTFLVVHIISFFSSTTGKESSTRTSRSLVHSRLKSFDKSIIMSSLH